MDLHRHQLEMERYKMLSLLNYEPKTLNKINELFNLNLKVYIPGKDIIMFSKADFQFKDVKRIIEKLDECDDFYVINENKKEITYEWHQPYPENHWNPLSLFPGAMQVLGSICVKNTNTMRLETTTKSRMISLIFYMLELFGKEIKLVSLAFKDPMEMIKRKSFK